MEDKSVDTSHLQKFLDSVEEYHMSARSKSSRKSASPSRSSIHTSSAGQRKRSPQSRESSAGKRNELRSATTSMGGRPTSGSTPKPKSASTTRAVSAKSGSSKSRSGSSLDRKAKRKSFAIDAGMDENGNKVLDMSGQGMTAIPSSVIKNHEVAILDLSSNNLRTLPADFKSLKNLIKLNLSQNSIRCTSPTDCGGIPLEFTELTHLQELRISENNMPYIPPVIWKLTNLRSLDISRNKIKVLLPQIGNLIALEKLNLQQTHITTLPAEIVFCQNLQDILLYGNAMESLPDTMPEMPKLKNISINYRGFCSVVDSYMDNLIRKGQMKSEHLPSVVFDLPAIRSLDLESTKINTVPEMFTDKLQEFSISNNYIRKFPTTLINLPQLQILDISHNMLTELPDEIGEMKSLTQLQLNNNAFDKIPASIGNLEKLTTLELNNNKIRRLPMEIKNLVRLTTLRIEKNSLKVLPDEICHLTNLETLDISENSITVLPVLLYNLANLTVAHCYRKLQKHGLWLYKNPIIQPPELVWKTDKTEGIFTYLKKLQISRTENLQRQKLLFLGETTCGKTSLVNAMIHGKSKPSDEIEKTRFQNQTVWRTENGIEVLLCDFGTDSVYQPLIPMFLDSKALVILVFNVHELNSDNYHDRIGKWLDILNLHAPGAVVKLVGTHWDLCTESMESTKNMISQNIEKHLQVYKKQVITERNELSKQTGRMEGNQGPSGCAELQQRHLAQREDKLEYISNHEIQVFPSILLINTHNGQRAIKKLIQEIETVILDKRLFPHAHQYIQDSWIKAKMALKQRKGLYLHWEQVKSIGKMAGLNHKSLKDCVMYLNEIGEVLWYPENPAISDILFHRPRALISLLCTLFRHDAKQFLDYYESRVFVSKGRMSEHEFDIAKEGFLHFGQLSYPMVKCFMFYEDIDNESFDTILDLLESLHVCCVIPQPDIPLGKNFDIPLLIMPQFNLDSTYNELSDLWPDTVDMEIAEFKVTYRFPLLPPTSDVFYNIQCGVHSYISDRSDWKGITYAATDDTELLLVNETDTNKEDSKDDHEQSIKLTIRSRNLTSISKVLEQTVLLINTTLAQRLGLYYTINWLCSNCGKDDFEHYFPAELLMAN